MPKISLEELLERDGSIVYRTKGTSMNPMLVQDRDLVCIRRKEPGEHFKENDVVLYRRGARRELILHRIVGKTQDGYVILGDNCIQKEYGIKAEDILGVLTEFCQNGKNIKVTDLEYLQYVKKLRRHEKGRIMKAKIRRRIAFVIRRI